MALITISKSIFTRSNQFFIKSNLLKNKFFQTSCSNNAIVPFKLSDIGEGIREVQIKEWFIKEGDKISQFDNICEVQSDKASVTITSRYDGVVQKICHGIDDMVLVGDTLIQIDTDNESTQQVASSSVNDQQVASELPQSLSSQSTTTFSTPSSSTVEQEILAIPNVRKLAKDMKVDLTAIKGSGKDGRILKEDILSSSKMVDNLLKEDQNQTITIKGYRKAMFKTMTESMKIPHFVYSDEIKLTNLVKLRQQIKTELLNDKNKLQTIDKNVIKQLTYMPFMLKAISLSLLEYPILNSSIIDGEKILLKSDHNIGVAMDTKEGLVVPNIKSVQTKSILEVAQELIRLQECGAKTSFSTRDLSDGTFALSNVGVVGGTYAKPCILPPNVAIGAIGQIQKLPRFNENNEVIGEHILQVSWAADHRIIDGVTMAKFSNLFKYYLEQPNILLINI